MNNEPKSGNEQANEAYDAWAGLASEATNHREYSTPYEYDYESMGEFELKEGKLDKLCNDAKKNFVENTLKNHSRPREEYDKLDNKEREEIDGWRFYEDAKALLDNRGAAYKNIVNAYNAYYTDKRNNPDLTMKNMAHPIDAREPKDWEEGYRNNEFGSKKLGSVLRYFGNSAKKIFGDGTIEYFKIIEELDSQNKPEKALEMFYKLKLKEFKDRKAIISQYEPSPNASFGTLLDVALKEFDKDGEVVVRYGDAFSARSYDGSGYEGELAFRRSNTNAAKQDATSATLRFHQEKSVKSPEELGFRDW